MPDNGTVEKIGLEGLMDRAQIYFSSGYRFHGRLDLEALKESFLTVSGAVDKYRYRLDFQSQDRIAWREQAPEHERFYVIETDDLCQAFADICESAHDLPGGGEGAEGQPAPLRFYVILGPRQGDEGEFILAHLNDHTYVDARSADFIFNKVVAYYSAHLLNQPEQMAAVLASVEQLKTVSAEQVIRERFDLAGQACHESNLEKMQGYQVEDVGGYGIPHADLDDCLDRHNQRRRRPVVRFKDLDPLVAQCRDRYPEVTRNSIACALLVKAMHDVNVASRDKPPGHNISFKMLSDLLPQPMRQKYSGNYIAFVPVTVNGGQPLAEIAHRIHQRIVGFKGSLEDVSWFSLVEDAIQAAQVGQAEEELSFIVTNWQNHDFTATPDFLLGCRSIRHQSGVNIQPRDRLGAALVNRPVMVINFSPNQELCLSFFPSLRDDGENIELADRFEQLITESEAR